MSDHQRPDFWKKDVSGDRDYCEKNKQEEIQEEED
jgi:hypothetical protein